MQKRKLGQGLEVSALSLGCMGDGKARERPDRPRMTALLGLRAVPIAAWLLPSHEHQPERKLS